MATHLTDDGQDHANTEAVKRYWENNPCGVTQDVTGSALSHSHEFFERIEEHRYRVEPDIHAVSQFTRHHGKKILEIGVGAGTDHLQWARAGAECYGVDLTDAAIDLTRAHLAAYGFESNLQRVNAESLPFIDDSFDLVYSWGVIHHAAHPEKIIADIHRVLRPGGMFIGMMYQRRSVAAFKVWVRCALLKGKPWRSFADVLWNHVESLGTKAYSVGELRDLFSVFASVDAQPMITAYDTSHWPRWIHRYFPDAWGWNIAIKARK